MYYMSEPIRFNTEEKGTCCKLCGNRMVDEDDAILLNDEWYHEECFYEEYARTFYEEVD